MTLNGIIGYIATKFPVTQYYSKYQKQLLTATFACSFIYLFYYLIPIHIFIAFSILAVSGAFLLKGKWNKVVRQGILRKLPPRLKALLLERSLMDIWSDIVYFPTITKVLGAFVRSAIIKPPPQKIHQQFKELSPNFQKIMTTKGLLHLAPSEVQKICIQGPDQPEILPQKYGKISTDWYNIEKYDKNPIKVHEVSMVQNVFTKIEQKIKWQHIAAMSLILSIGIKKMKVKRMGKMMIQNGVFLGMILLAIMILVKIRKTKRINNFLRLELEVEKAA